MSRVLWLRIKDPRGSRNRPRKHGSNVRREGPDRSGDLGRRGSEGSTRKVLEQAKDRDSFRLLLAFSFYRCHVRRWLLDLASYTPRILLRTSVSRLYPLIGSMVYTIDQGIEVLSGQKASWAALRLWTATVITCRSSRSYTNRA